MNILGPFLEVQPYGHGMRFVMRSCVNCIKVDFLSQLSIQHEVSHLGGALANENQGQGSRLEKAEGHE